MITRRSNDRSIASFQHGFIDQNLEPIIESQCIADLENSLVEPIDQTIVVREFVGHRQNVSNVVEFEVTSFGQGEKSIVSPMDPLSGVTRILQLFQDANDLKRTHERRIKEKTRMVLDEHWSFVVDCSRPERIYRWIRCLPDRTSWRIQSLWPLRNRWICSTRKRERNAFLKPFERVKGLTKLSISVSIRWRVLSSWA